MVHAIADVHEVADLPAVRVPRVGGAEQLHATGRLHLPPRLVHDARHPPLVRFARAVHVEELQPGPLRRLRPALVHFRERPRVEVVLALAVQVERGEFVRRGAVVEAAKAVAVGRGAGRVQQRRAVRGAPLPERPRVLDVVAEQVVPVGFGGGTARAEVKDRVRVNATCRKVIEEVIVSAEREPRQPREVGGLRGRDVVIDEQKRMPFGREPVCEICADEPGRAGDRDHGVPSVVRIREE